MIRIIDTKTGEQLPCKDAKDISMNLSRVLQGRDPKFKTIKYAIVSAA